MFRGCSVSKNGIVVILLGLLILIGPDFSCYALGQGWISSLRSRDEKGEGEKKNAE
jgi:hypothetical protein